MSEQETKLGMQVRGKLCIGEDATLLQHTLIQSYLWLEREMICALTSWLESLICSELSDKFFIQASEP